MARRWIRDGVTEDPPPGDLALIYDRWENRLAAKKRRMKAAGLVFEAEMSEGLEAILNMAREPQERSRNQES